MIGYALFETAIGDCGVAWGERGVVGLWLPDSGRDALRRRIAQRIPGARELPPPPPIQHAVESIQELFSGRRPDLSSVFLDMTGVADFDRRVYEAAGRIPAVVDRGNDPAASPPTEGRPT